MKYVDNRYSVMKQVENQMNVLHMSTVPYVLCSSSVYNIFGGCEGNLNAFSSICVTSTITHHRHKYLCWNRCNYVYTTKFSDSFHGGICILYI